MNDKIRKSLIDINAVGFEYNLQIVVNEKFKTIKERLIYNLLNSKRIDIAASYVVWSGLSLIYKYLEKFDKNSRILVTTEGFVTDPRSLRKLLELGLSVKVYNPYNANSKGFHLKSYHFVKKDYSTILIGSNNISARAFGLAHEMAVEIDSNEEGLFIEKYQDIFDSIWNDPSSVELTETFIKGYEDVYKEKAVMDDRIFAFGLTEEGISPNYMQKQALVELESAREHSNKGLVIAATGTGKTYLSAFDVKASNAKKVLFLVHNRLILTSAMASYNKIFKNKKMIELKSNNINEIDDADFIFTTDKTAHSHLYKKYPEDYFDYIIFDEAHRIGDDTLYNDLINYFNPKFTLGITATPERTNNPKFLFKLFEYNVVYEIRLLDAMEHELICPFTYYGLNLDEDLLDDNEQFDYVELAKFIKRLVDEKGHYGMKLKALLFASTQKEANEISKELNNIGYKSTAIVSSNASREETEKAILSLQSNDEDSLEIICAVNKFNEGVDIPEINTIFMIRNTMSSIIYLQQLGRGLRRTYDPHKYVTIFDIIGNSKNNYTIAEVLTANTTADKRILYKHASNAFETVSPFINVEIEEEAMKNIIKSISQNFTVKTKLKNKLRDELYRFNQIPTLKELYLDPNFKELDLLQLLFKSFYDPFEKYYHEKYDIQVQEVFVRKFLELITQFTFRGYDQKTLKDYVSLLKGNPSNNKTLMRVLLPKEVENGITTAINSDYNKVQYEFIEPFKLIDKNTIIFNEEVIDKLKTLNAYELYKEHIDLFELLSERPTYQMETFDLVDKGEFLFNVGAKDAYMNVVGERIDHDKKTVYCTIKITEKESHYDNYIVDNDKVVYYTQSSNTEEQAIRKVEQFIEEDYKFYLCAQFPHLGYSNTSYFNLGDVKINKVSDVMKTKNGKFNHEIEFLLEKEIPLELMMYKEEDL